MTFHKNYNQEEIFKVVNQEVVLAVDLLKMLNIVLPVPDLERINDPTLQIPAMASNGKIFYNPYWVVKTINLYCQQSPSCDRDIIFGVYGSHEFGHLIPDEILFQLLGERIEGPFAGEKKADKFTGLMLALSGKDHFIVRKVIAELPWEPNNTHPPGYIRAEIIFEGYKRGLALVEKIKHQNIENQKQIVRETQRNKFVEVFLLLVCVGLLLNTLSKEINGRK